MTTIKENTAIAKLQTDVAVMKNDIQYIKRTQDEMSAVLKNLAFASQKDLDEAVARIQALEKYNDDNKLGTVLSTMLGNRVFTWFVGLLIAAMLYYLVKTGGGLK